MATPPTDPALADPMFRELRQRHPDVDIVLLPPQPVVAEAEIPSLTALECSALVDDLDALVGDVLARISLDPAWTGAEQAGHWRTDEQGLTFHETAAEVGDLPEGANIALLRTAAAAFVGLGWQVKPVPGDRPRLVARRGPFSASATVRSDAFILKASTAHVRRIASVEGLR